MKRLPNHLIGIEQGELLLFSDFEDGGPMWLGSGPRSVRRQIEFSEAFREVPSVIVTVSMWDVDEGSNQRGDISAQAVTLNGFDLVFRTWGDTRIARIRAGWTAMGQLAHDDDWVLE